MSSGNVLECATARRKGGISTSRFGSVALQRGNIMLCVKSLRCVLY